MSGIRHSTYFLLIALCCMVHSPWQSSGMDLQAKNSPLSIYQTEALCPRLVAPNQIASANTFAQIQWLAKADWRKPISLDIPQFSIRMASEGDASAIVDLLREAFPSKYKSSPGYARYIKRRISQANRYILMAHTESYLLGMIAALNGNDKVWNFFDLAVYSGFRGLGIARALVTAGLQFVVDTGIGETLIAYSEPGSTSERIFTAFGPVQRLTLDPVTREWQTEHLFALSPMRRMA